MCSRGSHPPCLGTGTNTGAGCSPPARAHIQRTRPWDRRSPEVQLQLRVQEVEQRPPGHGLCVAVIDHQALVTDVLATDALGP